MTYKIDTSKPFIPDGYSLEENIDLGIIDWNPKKVSLYLSEKQKTGYISGEELREELKDKKPLNSAVLKFLLDNPKEIPEEWKGKYVYFFGTILRSLPDRPGVLYFYWRDGEWGWDYHYWLSRGGYTYGPSAVLASPLKLSPSLDPLNFEIKINGKEYRLIEK